MRFRLRLAFALVLCVPALAACGSAGGGGGKSDPDPARAIPATVAFYAEATVRPDGAQRDALVSLAKQVGKVDDPEQALQDYLSKQGKGDVSYEKDVKPWLGKRIGIGVTNVTADEPNYLAALGVKDVDKAKTFVEDQAKSDGAALKTYGDTKYYADDGTFIGVAGDYIAFADRLQDFKAVVDQAGKDKGSLAGDKGFSSAVGDLPDTRVGEYYFSVQTLGDLIANDSDVASLGGASLIRQLFGGIQGVAGALTPYDDRAVLETRVTTNGKAGAVGLLGSAIAPGLLREAPADSFAAYGIKGLGTAAKNAFTAFAGPFGGAALQSQLSRVGIDLDRDVYSWLGDVVVFARGTNASDTDGAVMIDATDADAAAAALPRLLTVARQQGGIAFDPVDLGGADQAWEAKSLSAQAGKPVYVARRGTRVTIAVGEDATRMALKPSSTLDASGAYDKAKQATGGYDPGLVLDLQKVIGLVAEQESGDPDFQRAKPYLEALDTLVSGSKEDGDTFVSRIAVTVE